MVAELIEINTTCVIRHSPIDSPFYHCQFENLLPSERFLLKYSTLSNDGEVLSTNQTVVHTGQMKMGGLRRIIAFALDVEEFHFLCRLNDKQDEIDFYWTSLVGQGYDPLNISLSTEEKSPWLIMTCDPYAFQGLCSTRSRRLEAGRDYSITATLSKHSVNDNRPRTERCSIRTSLAGISLDSLEHEFLNETMLRLTWRNDRFHIRARLKNVETNATENSIDHNARSALFVGLTEASLYRVELNVSQVNWPSLIQTSNYYIQTGERSSLGWTQKKPTDTLFSDLRRPSIERILRISDDTLVVDVRRSRHPLIKIQFCLEQLIERNAHICSSSNRFDELLPGSIYNVSIVLYRPSFQNRFIWQNRSRHQLVNTSESLLCSDSIPVVCLKPSRSLSSASSSLENKSVRGRELCRRSEKCSSHGNLHNSMRVH